jgi:hypothetical protein
VTTYAVTKSLVPALTFSSGGGDDAIVIDYTNGSPMPGSGIHRQRREQRQPLREIRSTSSARARPIRSAPDPPASPAWGTCPTAASSASPSNGGGGDDILNHNRSGRGDEHETVAREPIA